MTEAESGSSTRRPRGRPRAESSHTGASVTAQRVPLDQIELDYPGPVRLRVSVTSELAELIDLLAWVQIDTAQGVIRRGLAEWVVTQLEAHADMESMTVDQYIDLHVARRFVGLPPRLGSARRR